jgi:hypothetical protein
MSHKNLVRIPIFGRRRATFDSERQAEAYGFDWQSCGLTASSGVRMDMANSN